jgi:hypothetical protein
LGFKDELVLDWLMRAVSYVIQLHHKLTGPIDNRGPRYGDPSIPTEDEGFARWMGWRGEEAQEQELNKMRGQNPQKKS